MPIEAAVLYGLLWDRNKLSEKNKWMDEVGTFQYFSVNTTHKKELRGMKIIL